MNWIFKYTAVIILSFAAASFIYRSAIKTLKDENAKTNTILLSSIQKNIDGRLADAINLSNQIYTNAHFRAVAFSKDAESGSHILSLKNLNDSFS